MTLEAVGVRVIFFDLKIKGPQIPLNDINDKGRSTLH